MSHYHYNSYHNEVFDTSLPMAPDLFDDSCFSIDDLLDANDKPAQSLYSDRMDNEDADGANDDDSYIPVIEISYLPGLCNGHVYAFYKDQQYACLRARKRGSAAYYEALARSELKDADAFYHASMPTWWYPEACA